MILCIIHTAPKLNTLLPALVHLPADKIPQFALALGVPDSTFGTAETNHQRDANRVKMECLKWWLNNSGDISWEAIAKALKTEGVDQKNLADKILQEKCGHSIGELVTILPCHYPFRCYIIPH